MGPIPCAPDHTQSLLANHLKAHSLLLSTLQLHTCMMCTLWTPLSLTHSELEWMVAPVHAVLVNAAGTPQMGSWVANSYGSFPFPFVGVSMSANSLLPTPYSLGHSPNATLAQLTAEVGGCAQSPLQQH